MNLNQQNMIFAQQIKQTILYILIFFVITSCFKEENIIILPPTQGDLQTGQAAISENYKNQVYYSLKTNSVTRTNVITDWDLGFSCSDTSWHIVLNNAKTMLAGNSNKKVFAEVTSSDGLNMKFDSSSGKLDSLALSDWLADTINLISSQSVYVIDRGYDESFNHLGFKKVIFDILNDKAYQIKYADLNGEHEQTISLQKDTLKNYVHLSFDNGEVDIEPNKEDWSILFTSYQSTLFTDEGDPVPYLVRGVLINPYKVSATTDTISLFDEISLEYAQSLNYSYRSDIIGYEWKFYNFNEGIYSIVADLNFLIHNNDRYYYKFRFYDYYNDQNQKGYPSFEFKRL